MSTLKPPIRCKSRSLMLVVRRGVEVSVYDIQKRNLSTLFWVLIPALESPTNKMM